MSQPPYGQGPGGPGMPPPPPGMGGQPADTSGNALNIISLVAGIVSIVLCCFYAGIWGGVPAIILGVLGRKKADNGQATNKTLGTVGLILGIIGAVYFVVQIILLVSGVSMNLAKQLQNQT
ncbi:DUF4190 domain-containing protein [Actinocatenispora sera]|nr:DUF4190 domain-containing protein [Actinocatenispora sera]